MWLANFGKGVWWQLGSLGAVLLNVIEGGKKRRAKVSIPRSGVDIGSVLQALPEAVFLLETRGSVADCNQAAEKLVGQSRGDLLGVDVESWLRDRLQGAEDFRSLISRALRGESVRSGHMILQCASGDSMRVTASASPVWDHAGKFCCVLLTLQDVTELSALQRSSDANERQVAVGQMTAGLVHDFNNVLNTINDAVAVLELDHQRSGHDQTVLGIIGNAVHYGAETIRNTRKYLSGSKEKPSRVDVRKLMDEVLEFTNPVLQTHSGINVVRENQECGFVNASADELRRAFTNLVLNALDAMPEGGTLIVICAQSNGRVVVSLRDTGVGIPVEAQKKIFSAYYTTKAKGTGLGLAGARRAIQAQGGDIRFDSAVGAGTTFYVTLPLANQEESQKPSAA
jgi:PAS domain S-box-containing protein